MIANGAVAAILNIFVDREQLISYGLWLGALAATTLVAAGVFAWLRRFYTPVERQDDLAASDQLAQYRSLYEQGVISEEEFIRLRTLLGGELLKAARKTVKLEGKSPTGSIANRIVPPADKPIAQNGQPPETGFKTE